MGPAAPQGAAAQVFSAPAQRSLGRSLVALWGFETTTVTTGIRRAKPRPTQARSPENH